jgi:hypothetical protein
VCAQRFAHLIENVVLAAIAIEIQFGIGGLQLRVV